MQKRERHESGSLWFILSRGLEIRGAFRSCRGGIGLSPCALHSVSAVGVAGSVSRTSDEPALFLVITSKSDSLAYWFWEPLNKSLFGLNK